MKLIFNIIPVAVYNSLLVCRFS